MHVVGSWWAVSSSPGLRQGFDWAFAYPYLDWEQDRLGVGVQ